MSPDIASSPLERRPKSLLGENPCSRRHTAPGDTEARRGSMATSPAFLCTPSLLSWRAAPTPTPTFQQDLSEPQSSTGRWRDSEAIKAPIAPTENSSADQRRPQLCCHSAPPMERTTGTMTHGIIASTKYFHKYYTNTTQRSIQISDCPTAHHPSPGVDLLEKLRVSRFPLPHRNLDTCSLASS